MADGDCSGWVVADGGSDFADLDVVIGHKPVLARLSGLGFLPG
ncbi:MAG: hypothetical protein QM655_08415 [Nocardioidaceae bacterium]